MKIGFVRLFYGVRNSGLILGGGFGKICASLDGKSRVRRNGRGQDIVRERAGVKSAGGQILKKSKMQW